MTLARHHDGLALTVGATLTGLGTAFLVNASPWTDLTVWYPTPPNSGPIGVLLELEQSAVFAVAVIVLGLGWLWWWAGGPLPWTGRGWYAWLTWWVLVNLFAARLMVFLEPRNPPWWTLITLGAIVVAWTARLLGTFGPRQGEQ